MQMTVGTSAAALDLSAYDELGEKGRRVSLQNLGPGDVYIDTLPGVTTGSGTKLALNDYLEIPDADDQAFYLVASAASDLRIMVVG